MKSKFFRVLALAACLVALVVALYVATSNPATERAEQSPGAAHVEPRLPPASFAGAVTPLSAIAAPPEKSPSAPAVVTETRSSLIERQLASSDPTVQMKGYLAIQKCGIAMVVDPESAKNDPADAAYYMQELNDACNGLTAELIARRFAVGEALAKANSPGAAAMYVRSAPDGTSITDAMKSPNYSPWFTKALGYVEASAKAGDLDAIHMASSLLSRIDGRSYDAFVYRVAQMEAFAASSPGSKPMIEAQLLGESRNQTNLSEAQIKEAIAAGQQLGKKVYQYH